MDDTVMNMPGIRRIKKTWRKESVLSFLTDQLWMQANQCSY